MTKLLTFEETPEPPTLKAKVETRVLAHCQICGKEFAPRWFDVSHGKGRFDTWACRAEADAAQVT